MALAVVLTGLVILAWLAKDLNLSRAAMESRYTPGQATGRQMLNLQPGTKDRQLKKLGIGRPASRLPGRSGWQSLVWKDLIQSSRLGWLRQSLYALAILLFSVGALTVADWGVRAWLALLWVIVVGQIATRRLQADLARWGIFRLLPLPSRRLILGDSIFPIAMITALSWLGLLIGVFLGADPLLAVLIGCLLPGLSANVTLAAVLDSLRQGNTASLLAGDAPQPGILGVLLGAGVIALAAVLIGWAQVFGLLLAFWLTLLTAVLLLRIAAGRLQRMR